MSTSSKGSAGTKSNGLETAQTAIKNLDRMIAGMRQRRADCGNQIQEDTAEIERITKEADEINRKINHIKSARAERVKRRDELQGILDHHMALMKASIKSASTLISNTNHSSRRLVSTQLPKGRPNYLSKK
eukprot:CAMPEP_0113893792 /NCGR_PEP_ID=MMETSP0780_2-20120614/16307_1 /TAXON_ID=652834 /ORGANISM="Palpitomonas bilix" /LENGTH=130 /DNA_ID=CAMNT_0000884157 /DNA_START=162 /DNA_END=554 /DNA_ORIENTATION=+ /assembly_acc=CAM_ASM_000599